MANRHRASWSGGVDSKYYHRPEQFDKDIQKKLNLIEKDKQYFFNMIDSKIADNPARASIIFNSLIDAALEIKEKYNLV